MGGRRVFQMVLTLTLFLQFVRASINEPAVLLEDHPFPRVTAIGGRNVTCEDDGRLKFVSETWTCTNIKVNGVRLTYGYPNGMAADKTCGVNKGTNNLAGLCHVLLNKIGVLRKVWTVYVSDAVCKNKVEPRVEFRVDDPKKMYHYSWHDISGSRNGYVKSIQCMALP